MADYQAADEWNQFTNIQERFPYTVTATSADNTMGSAAVTTDPTCANNSTTVAATPNCGYRFVRWENAAGNTVSTDNPCTLTVSRDTTLIAVFETGETRISLVCPSGQTLYYRLDCTNLTATVVPQNGSNPYYTTEPAGNLVIPSSIEYGNNTYTVTTIGENAFRYCTSLTSAVIPNSITSIGGHAFFDCWGIESLSIGNSVETIGFEAFASCYGLSSITVAADNTHFDSRNNCNAIIVTATNTLIAGCQTTVIPNSVTAIGDNAFGNCETLTTIHIPSAVSYIHERAFMNCSGLISMTVDADNTHYDSRENCNAIIETSTNTLIAGCRNTVIPNSVTSIAEYAFRYCRYLTSITIPSKVASIGSESFYGCSNLAQITLLAAIPPSIGSTTFQYVSTDIPVHIPCGTLSAYQASNRWSSFTNLVEGDLFPYSLSVTSAHSAMGSAAVTVEPTCANNGATITATPNTGYQFFRWSDGNTDNPRTVTVVSDTTFVAEFATETQSWDQATACPGWNNPNSFITGGVDVNIYSGHGVSISSNKPCPNPVTGVTGVSEMTTMYTASQLATVTTAGCSNAIPDNGNQFLIISDTLGYDPNTGNNLRYVPMHLSTQIKKSIRIGDGCASTGNASSGAQLNYTMRVTPDNAVMIVYYAIVAQAPGHGQQGDPTVVIRATKKNNAGNWQQISDTLAYYFSSTPVGNNSNNCPNLEFATLAANGQTGWHTLGVGYSTVYYKDWERVVLDLSNFLYDTIQLQFLSYDCLYNAHYGYAYIAGECRPAGYILPQDTVIHINMAMVGDSLFSQENQSMVVTHPDSTYVKLRFDVEPTAERIEVLDQAQNLVATFYNATEEHIFRLTTGLYTIRAVFPGGATFEGTIDFTNELQE